MHVSRCDKASFYKFSTRLTFYNKGETFQKFKMQDDEIEIPTHRVLYRQSSRETRLSPIHLSESGESDSDDDAAPKIVGVVKKQEDIQSASNKETIQKEIDRILGAQLGLQAEDVKAQKNLQTQVTKIDKDPGKEEIQARNKTGYDGKEFSVANIKGLTFSKKMASPRPKSPRPAVGNKNDKEESFWDKIGTLGRKKRIKEVQEVQAEGKYAIDSPGSPTAPDYPPEDYALEDNEERSMIEPKSFEDKKLLELMQILCDWINDELANQRIIVKNLEEDLYDGQVFQKLIEKLTGDKLDVPEVTQSEEGQRQKLSIVLAHVNRILGLQRNPAQNKWGVESVHSKNIVSILHLLVALVRHFRAPIRLPENVSVTVVVVKKVNGQLDYRVIREEITSHYDDVGMRCERDAFDTLFDHAPEKLQVVKKSLVTFVNKHLSKVNLEVTELDTQFHDGVYLTLLMGLLEGFFVPLHSFYLTPQDFDQKVHNVAFAFELMQDVGILKPKARPEDIVNSDLKSTLRVLYNLFTKYKTLQ